jgi:hypothetical protein
LAVVLPKSITASVGCTVSFLNHYLALLPPSHVVRTSWTLPAGVARRHHRADGAARRHQQPVCRAALRSTRTDR